MKRMKYDTTLDVSGFKIGFNAEESNDWEIFDAQLNARIGVLAVDEDGLFIEANIENGYQCKGVATAVVRYLVKECGRSFFFWKPDGLTYDDARHLSQEGAKWASKLVAQGLARWVDGLCHDEESN